LPTLKTEGEKERDQSCERTGKLDRERRVRRHLLSIAAAAWNARRRARRHAGGGKEKLWGETPGLTKTRRVIRTTTTTEKELQTSWGERRCLRKKIGTSPNSACLTLRGGKKKLEGDRQKSLHWEKNPSRLRKEGPGMGIGMS